MEIFKPVSDGLGDFRFIPPPRVGGASYARRTGREVARVVGHDRSSYSPRKAAT